MSAFICRPETIIPVAIFAAQNNRGWGPNVNPRSLRHPNAEAAKQIDRDDTDALATFYADTLYQENIRSVRARYPDDTWETLPGPTEKPIHLIVAGDRLFIHHVPEPVAILKACNCIEYQSCESDDWRETLAHELLEYIRDAAIGRLPGYDAAPWD